jgi:hypothetical protein
METLALIALLGILIIFFVKMYNVMNGGKLYPGRVIFIGFSLAWIFWLLFFMNLSAGFLTKDTITTPDAETYTVTVNSYAANSLYLNVNNILVGLISLFTFIEVLYLFGGYSKIRKPLKARGGKNALW